MSEAAYLVMQLFGHETAHLDAREQMAVARECIIDLTDTLIELAEWEQMRNAGRGHLLPR
jgi:hypothetical protein